MKLIKILATLSLVTALGACASPDIPSRNATLSPTGIPAAAQDVAMAPKYRVTRVVVSVPKALRVSEANVFFPLADIVWRGEPRGDRYAQVKKIFEEGFARGTKGMTKGPAVIVQVEVERFHILTEKARIFTGGTYDIRFLMTVREAGTGRVIEGPRLISAAMPGVGGQQALEQEARGLTQRVTIVARLAQVSRDVLSAPIPAAKGRAPMSRGRFNPAEL